MPSFCLLTPVFFRPMLERIQPTEKTSPQRRDPQAELRLSKGEIIRGRVIGRQGGGDVIVSFRGRPFAAQVETRVREGEEYPFQVKSSGNRVILKVLEEPKIPGPAGTACSRHGQRLAALLRDLSTFQPPGDLSARSHHLVRNLGELLPSLIYTGPGEDPGIWLSRFFEVSGSFWEHKVAKYLLGRGKGSWRTVIGEDLKGMLLELRQSRRAEGRAEPRLEAFSQKVEEAVRLIEGQQLENLSLRGDEGGWFCFIPTQAEEGLVQADLYCVRKRGSKEIRFALYLEFTLLGPLEVAASILESSLTVQFRAADEERARLIEQGLPLLEAGLRELGITTRSMRCTVLGDASPETGSTESVEGPEVSLDVVI
ncbi:MAG: flagellar hook-length control protein FliK [Thermodesulfobacteriota bacterium]